MVPERCEGFTLSGVEGQHDDDLSSYFTLGNTSVFVRHMTSGPPSYGTGLLRWINFSRP